MNHRLSRHFTLLIRLWPPALRLAALALAPWHVSRALAHPDFSRVYPDYCVGLRWVLLLQVAVVTLLIMVWPQGLLIAAVVLVASTILRLWQARVRYGVKRGLPPGSLDLLAPTPLLDPSFFLEAARTHGPIFKCSNFARSQICVADLAAGSEILHGHADRLRARSLPFHQFVPGGFLRRMEGPAHDSHHRLFSAAFSHRLTPPWQQVLEPIVVRGLERMIPSADNLTGVRPQPCIAEFVFEAWVHICFGLKASGQSLERLRGIFDRVDIRNPQRVPREQVERALDEIEQLLRDKRDQMAGHSALRQILDRQPTALDDLSIVRNLIYTLSTSVDDVSGLLMWIFKVLSDNPTWVEQLRADLKGPSTHPVGTTSLADRIVSETLRLHQSEFVLREVTREIRYRNFVIPRGWLLRICVQEAHRDPRIFEHPDSFEPDRFMVARPSRDEYSPFGMDRHACIGESLARVMGRVFTRELVARYDWEVTEDGPQEMSVWRHWAPSSRFRVRLRSLEGAGSRDRQRWRNCQAEG